MRIQICILQFIWSIKMRIISVNPNIDDMVEIYIDQISGCVAKYQTRFKINATVVAIYRQYNIQYILGWKPGQTLPTQTHSYRRMFYGFSNGLTTTPNLNAYTDFCAIDDTYEIESITRASVVAQHNKTTITQQILAQQQLPDTLPSIQVAKSVMKESPCRNKTCGKMNDAGAKKCWNCELENPNG